MCKSTISIKFPSKSIKLHEIHNLIYAPFLPDGNNEMHTHTTHTTHNSHERNELSPHRIIIMNENKNGERQKEIDGEERKRMKRQKVCGGAQRNHNQPE